MKNSKIGPQESEFRAPSCFWAVMALHGSWQCSARPACHHWSSLKPITFHIKYNVFYFVRKFWGCAFSLQKFIRPRACCVMKKSVNGKNMTHLNFSTQMRLICSLIGSRGILSPFSLIPIVFKAPWRLRKWLDQWTNACNKHDIYKGLIIR